MSAFTEKMLIMGAAVGYKEEQIAPFLISLRKAGYNGDVVLIVSPDLASRAGKLPMFHGVTLLTASQWFPVRRGLIGRKRALLILWFPQQMLLWGLVRVLNWLPLSRAWRFRLQLMVGRRLYPPTESRYLLFLRFLREQPYSRVLLTDVRDVLFQTDPFVDLPQQGLAVSIEPRQLSIATEPYNAFWVRLAYGSGMLEQIGGMPVVCSGVTYGDRASILKYLELMAREFFHLNFHASGQSGMDQGVHNVLVWKGWLGEFRQMETLDSPVATLGMADQQNLRLNPEGKLLNQDGSIVSVVHQYDRLPELRSRLLDSLTR